MDTSAVPQPAFEVPAMNDPEDQDHAILLQHVVHHTVVTHPKAVEGIADSLDRLD